MRPPSTLKLEGRVAVINALEETAQRTQAASGAVWEYQSTKLATSPNTTYHFRAVASNARGIRYGADQLFETPFSLVLVAGWNLVTPGMNIALDPPQVFGDGYMVAYSWNATQGTYFVPTNLEAGIGYWVKMALDKTVTLTGSVAPSPFETELSMSWNMVGNPFITSLHWSDVIVRKGLEAKNPAEAKTAGWIGPAFSWDGAVYSMADFVNGDVLAGKGYWIKAMADGLSLLLTRP
jgi:hypothetical protein